MENELYLISPTNCESLVLVTEQKVTSIVPHIPSVYYLSVSDSVDTFMGLKVFPLSVSRVTRLGTRYEDRYPLQDLFVKGFQK